ncbi:MAG: amidohydrolase family protein [Gemmatimonadaceae bacterium]|nr:amidohydrolase family protein [Gemmatimonadaceae bacterium]
MRYRISGVQVFDGIDLQPATRTVDVDGARIASDGRGTPANVIDFSHLPHATVLPGLIDSHLHFAIGGADQGEKANPAALVALRMAHSAQVNLRAGITTVRDMGAKEHIDVHFKEAVALGFVRSPRYLVSGKPIIATGGHCTYMGRQVDGPEEARKATREQLNAGVDWIKMMVTGGIMTRGTDPRTQQLFDDEIEAVVKAAHAAGKPVAVHCQGGPAVVATIKAGVDSLEHGMWLGDEAIDLMLKHDTAYVPTLSAFHLIAEGESIEGVSPPAWAVEKSKVATEAHRGSFTKAVEAGVRIVAGTDYKHGSLPFELSLMADWGMPNVDVLRSATSRAADLLRLPNVGRIAEGAEADLIVVAGDPLQDIGALVNVELIVQAGEVIFDKRISGEVVSILEREVVR